MTPTTPLSVRMTDAELLRLREHWVGVQRGAARKVSALDREIDTRKKRRAREKR